MPDPFDDERLTDLIDDYLRHLDGDCPAPVLEGLDVELQAAARNAFRIVDAAWRSDPDMPSLEEDPVAIALGFVEPTRVDHSIALVGSQIASARKRRGLKVTQLAAQLSALGSDVTVSSLFALEGAKATEVPQRTAASLAKVLDVSVASLSVSRARNLDDFTAWLYSKDFDAEVAQWLSVQDLHASPAEYATAARSRLLEMAQRSGGQDSRKQWVSMLHIVLADLA